MKKTIYMAIIERAMMTISAEHPDFVDHEITIEEMDEAVKQVLKDVFYNENEFDKLIAFARDEQTPYEQGRMIMDTIHATFQLLEQLDSRDYDHDVIRNIMYEYMTMLPLLGGQEQTMNGAAIFISYRWMYHLTVVLLDYMAKRDFDERLDLFARMMISHIHYDENDYIWYIEEL